MDLLKQKQQINIYIISDSAGETAGKLAQAASVQYPSIEFITVRRPFVTDKILLEKALTEAKDDDALIMQTIVHPELIEFSQNFCQEHDLFAFDVLSPFVEEIQRRTEITPTYERGALHHLNKNYFRRISAMEFAVKYDDGKDPRGFLKADIVLLGVSRTSKTPLSIFLANKGFKVANLPVMPQAHIPKEIWEVDSKKIVGLTNDPEILNSIRQERMRAYGLDINTAYSDIEKIRQELTYAHDLYEKIGCEVINVASLSIEETASMILNALNLQDNSYSDD
ncbi:regulator of PEP synthase PpsR (kinase-PPPase family) [Enterococcus sp. PF1-24]|uniref:pyruvate, water dikinase regulatory protein n=1 Tax=unclassified Enterococcus TaxID=2608891 RepID=UPI0024753273|nr:MULTISPECIES: pyruvate, water dikinase regulatory protein [unclassified Enterococcus]MDH6365110.1 regulator of PEP synthase PpsR (kinase-PPPase family) [Enterococcus sp. PFB1-1]MDH6402211.1 regulator of PEP synthase PpsR (kinase-PPPase family) [Enterococcus sp. PF1-24]